MIRYKQKRIIGYENENNTDGNIAVADSHKRNGSMRNREQGV